MGGGGVGVGGEWEAKGRLLCLQQTSTCIQSMQVLGQDGHAWAAV